MTMRRLLIAPALCLVLTACPPPETPIRTVMLDGKLAFVTDEGDPSCVASLEIWSESGEVIWSIETGRGRTGAPIPCGFKFPLRYGVVPTGMEEKIKAKPLQPGVAYGIEGDGIGSYRGAFRYRIERLVTVQTLSRDDPAYEVAMPRVNQSLENTLDAIESGADQPANTAPANSVPRPVKP